MASATIIGDFAKVERLQKRRNRWSSIVITLVVLVTVAAVALVSFSLISEEEVPSVEEEVEQEETSAPSPPLLFPDINVSDTGEEATFPNATEAEIACSGLNVSEFSEESSLLFGVCFSEDSILICSRNQNPPAAVPLSSSCAILVGSERKCFCKRGFAIDAEDVRSLCVENVTVAECLPLEVEFGVGE